MCGRRDSRLDQRWRIFLRSCRTGNSYERFMCVMYNVFSENHYRDRLCVAGIVTLPS